jgi:mannitol operon repressor
MPDEPASDDAQPEMRELDVFTDEFAKESDRGAVLVAASRLDEILKSILVAYLRDTKSSKDLLEGFSVPLGTFSARASAAHALSLIEDQEFEEITLIRKIRNEFGHKWRDIGFDSDKIKALCVKLPWMGPDETKPQDRGNRQRFNLAVIVLLTDLLWRERLVSRERRNARSWPNKIRVTSVTSRSVATAFADGKRKRSANQTLPSQTRGC